jgi:hypothetical protein
MGVQVIHSCCTIHGTFKNPIVNRCSTCRACDSERQVHSVATTGGVMHVTRCGHCDGADAHVTIRHRRGTS